MYFELGTPKKLGGVGPTVPPLDDLKRRFDVAVLDDEPFQKLSALRNHGFRVVELGGDLRSIEQIAAFPVVVCDIKGVGKSFESRYEGAHVISEIRKAFPDKYLIAFTGMRFNVSYNDKLVSADKSIAKDDPIDVWVQLLESALRSVGDPKERWIRFRSNLLKRGVELHDVFRLEQAFIAAIEKRDSEIFSRRAKRLTWPSDTKELALAFAKVAITQIIAALLAAHR